MKLRDNGRIFVVFYMAGFLMGVLYANLISKDYIASMGIFDEYFLNSYVQKDLEAQEYLWYLFRVRCIPVAALFAAGYLKIRKGVVLVSVVWTGFLCGILLTASVMQLGMKGIFLCLVAGFPQLIFYAAGIFVLIWTIYYYPSTKWNSQKIMALFLLIGIGIILECYVNPPLLKMFLKRI